MPLPRTVPVALLVSASLYVPIVILRNVLPTMSWESRFGLSHTFDVRILGLSLLALASVLAMASSKVAWREFGFCRPLFSTVGIVSGALLLGILSTLALKTLGGSGLDTALAGASALEIASILLLATCVEEVFVRGWLQGFLAPLQGHRVRWLGGISVPVLTGSLVFGAMHLSLTLSAIDGRTISCVLVFTTLLGLLAGLARERSKSLLSAIWTHLAGNIGGVAGGIIYVVMTGRVPPMT